MKTGPLILGGFGMVGLALFIAASAPDPKPSLPPPAPASTPPHPPLPGRILLTSAYGGRTDPFTGEWKFHHGIDLPAPIGTPVYAPYDGVVARIDKDGVGRGVTNGNAVFVAAGAYRWCFLHLSAVAVSSSQRVGRGQLLGYVGSTGRSTSPHLHLQVYDDAGKTLDPEPLFPAGTFVRRARA